MVDPLEYHLNQTKKKLSQAECDALPDGAEVFIKWSGGNGPYKYTILRKPCWELAYAKECNSFVTFVGKEAPSTQVWLA